MHSIHPHDESHEHEPSPIASEAAQSLDRRLGWSIGLNVLITVTEFVGGLMSGSLALLSDAMHNLSDVAALAIALVARKLGGRPPTAKHSFGLARLEVISALVNGATILIVSTLICREAVLRLLHPEPVQGTLMLVVALIGLGANSASMLLLKNHAHGDLNMRGAFLHLLQDTLSSVVVVAAALFSGWRYGAYLDPIASILVIAFIIRGSWGLLREALSILLEATPTGLDVEALRADVQTRFAVKELAHVHAWELAGGRRMLTAEVQLADMPLTKVEEVLAAVRAHLVQHWSIAHATLEARSGAQPVIDPDRLQREHSRPSPPLSLDTEFTSHIHHYHEKNPNPRNGLQEMHPPL
jgi:cobalt-zinc-cadmium efflux system protein